MASDVCVRAATGAVRGAFDGAIVATGLCGVLLVICLVLLKGQPAGGLFFIFGSVKVFSYSVAGFAASYAAAHLCGNPI